MHPLIQVSYKLEQSRKAGKSELVSPGVAYLNVSTLQSQAEASLLIFHKMKRHLWVAFLLQVGDDGLTDQLGITHHVENL